MTRWPCCAALLCSLIIALASVAPAGVPRTVLAEHYGDCC